MLCISFMILVQSVIAASLVLNAHNFGKVAHLHLQFYAILFYLVKVLLEKLTGDMKMTRL